MTTNRYMHFAWASVAWGVQFHPEFDERVMQKYVEEYCDRPKRARS